MTDDTDNIDPTEVDKFARLAARWWDMEGEFKSLHEINPLRLDFIHQRTPLNGLEVLDVGCGGGILSESMARLGATVTAIDSSAALLDVARLHALESGVQVEYRNISVQSLTEQQPGHWDVVTCLEMLEHVPRPAAIVEACATLVKPGGSVYFSTINRNLKSFLFAIVGAEYMLNLLPKGTHQYARLIRPSELNHWCEAASLRALEMTGMHYNPIGRRYTVGDGVAVNYLLHCQRD